MDADDPEQYIRDLERGVSQTPEAEPFPAPSQLLGTGSGPPSGGPGARSFRPCPRASMLVLACVVAIMLVGVFLKVGGIHFGNPFGPTTVQGNLIMENSGLTDTIACNDGDLKLDGDNNRYTITGHCRRLEVFGSGNHVTVESADTISTFGDDNAMIYHLGSPKINMTGNNDIVSRG
jgi:hypothetical protein